MMLHIIGFVLGVILDWIIGDPHFMPHPVRAMGNLIRFLEQKLLGSDPDKKGRNPKREKAGGTLLWFAVTIASAAATLVVLTAAYVISKYLGILAEAVLTCYILAARSLCTESMAVYQKLQVHDTKGARYALSMIVGRDTGGLVEEEMIKAAVETVAENTSDGVIAPLLYAAVGGPVCGMLYKAVNTMDSMLGYHNDRYEYFGSFAARADDLFNLIPARISALFMIAASGLLGFFSERYNGRNALRIWVRDRYQHKSPNSAQTESVCAGALGLKLGGTHSYQGIFVEKPTIGDACRKPEALDIKRANRLMFLTQALVFLAVILLLLGIRAI
ncbi:MAG: cobalamin biosynthesis protein CobD [Lachnospiraceae bacterium]|nr:cobalamin biosynthesis protein CobD [Lachnospiraceae bacterium]